MHVPTAAVVRPAQWSVIGIKGARQRVLNRGTTWNNQDQPKHQRWSCNPPHKWRHKPYMEKFYTVAKTNMQWLIYKHTAGLVSFGFRCFLECEKLHRGLYKTITTYLLIFMCCQKISKTEFLAKKLRKYCTYYGNGMISVMHRFWRILQILLSTWNYKIKSQNKCTQGCSLSWH